MQTYSIKDITQWKQNRDQMDYSIIEYNTRTQKVTLGNQKHQLVHSSKNQNKWNREDYANYEKYFSVVMIIINLKSFILEDMSDETIEITPENVTYYYIEYCKQNEIKVNESKIDNYVESMQQPLVTSQLKEQLENIIFAQAINFTESAKYGN